MLLGETDRFRAFCTFWRSEKNLGIQLQLATINCRHQDSLDSETLVPYQCVLKREDDLGAILTPSLAYFGPNYLRVTIVIAMTILGYIANKMVVIMVIITILSTSGITASYLHVSRDPNSWCQYRKLVPWQPPGLGTGACSFP